MVERLLIQSQGSKNDEAYAEQMVETKGLLVPFHEFFQMEGIKTLKQDLVNSCHGDTKLTLELAKNINALAHLGYRIVCVQQGGLYFAKPSIEAANMPTVPVISIPLDGGMFGGLDAFLAPQIPSGTAVIGGVGVGNYQAAANVAKEILLHEFEGVYVYNASDKLKKKLDEFGIPILGQASESIDSGLVVGCIKHYEELTVKAHDQRAYIDSLGSMGVFTPVKDADPNGAATFMGLFNGMQQSVYVRGEDNVAFFAAKIFAAGNPTVYRALNDAAKNKKNNSGYDQKSITLESFTDGGK